MRRVDRYRRRGFGYIAVLGIATIVSVIGLSALMTTRIELRAASQGEDAVTARLGASAAIELAVDTMAANANWRSTYSHDAWTSAFAVEDVAYSFKLVDEQDGDLANDRSQPVRLYGKATVGDAVRIYSVLLKGSPVLETRIATGNDDAEQRSSDGWMYRDSSDLEMAYDDY